MKKIVIFGATGNTGVYFVDYCKQHVDPAKYEIIAVGRKDTDFFAQNGIRYEIDTPVPAEIVIGGKTRMVEKGSYLFGETE